MATLQVDTNSMAWSSATPIYGPAAVVDGHDLVQLKVLSDRRAAGGGIAYLVRFAPPPGKAIKIIAVAQSDEHIFGLEGGRGTKTGQPLRASGNYRLNPKGQPHSAFIAQETVGLVIYAGEPDEIRALELVDIEPAGAQRREPSVL